MHIVGSMLHETRKSIQKMLHVPPKCGSSQTHLIVVGEVEVSAEPGLDLGVGAAGVDVALGGHGVVVVQPAAAVHDMVLLKHTESRS